MFETARQEPSALIFIDELDAVGRARGAGVGGGHDEREQTLNQILSEMDGFEEHENVIVLAATNRPDVLDSALLRPGRFDRKVTLDRPHKDARKAILGVHVRKVPLAEDVNLDEIAGAPSASPAPTSRTWSTKLPWPQRDAIWTRLIITASKLPGIASCWVKSAIPSSVAKRNKRWPTTSVVTL